MYNAWLLGLAGNPAAPDDVLLRLLDAGWLDHYGTDRGFSPAVVDAIVSRGSRSAQYGLTRNWHVDPEVRARTVEVLEANPGDELILPGLMHGPNSWDWPRPLPIPAIERIGLTLDFERDKQYIDDAGSGTSIPRSVVLAFWNHREPKLRAWSCLYWPRMPDAVRAALLADPDPEVRARAEYAAQPFTPDDFDYSTPLGPVDEQPRVMSADEQWRHSMLRNGCVSREVVEHVLTCRPVDEGQRREWLHDISALAANPSVPPDYLPAFLAHGCALALAGREDLTPDLMRSLATDSSAHVRERLLFNPLLSEQERLGLDVDLNRDDDRILATWGMTMLDIQDWPPADLGGLISQATSAIPAVRRTAAGNRFLPAEYVARLAEDDNQVVRLWLCLRQPEVPLPLLERTWFECPTYRGQLVTRPDFPTGVMRGLAVHAGHPDPDVRLLATYDPDLPPDDAERLSRDYEGGIRQAALRHPNLPVARIREQLAAYSGGGVDRLIEAAMANPSLPVEDMYRILDERIDADI